MKLTIYDVLGREISILVNKELDAGRYKVIWNAVDFSNGVYFYKIVAGDFQLAKKMVLMK